MNREKFVITTSDNIPFSEIKEQLGVVDSQIVIGANIFRDVFANWRDVFGGKTKGYKKDIDKMKKAALQNVKQQANEKGANAITSLRIDLDEVSGGGKSMFMINIYGSAVKLSKSVLEAKPKNDVLEEFSVDDIKYYKTRNRLKKKINDSDQNNRTIDLDSISKYNLWSKEIVNDVLSFSNNTKSMYYKNINDNLEHIPISYLEEFLLTNINKNNRLTWNDIYRTLEEKGWSNYELLYQLLNEADYIKRFRALRLCKISKYFYKKKDISALKKIGNFLRDSFDKSVDTKQVRKMIGSKEVFTCPKCLDNVEIDKNCEACGANKFGLKKPPKIPEEIGKDLLSTAAAIESAVKDVNT